MKKESLGDEYYEKARLDVLFKKGVTLKEAKGLVEDLGYDISYHTTATGYPDIGMYATLKVPEGREREAEEALEGMKDKVYAAIRPLNMKGFEKILDKVMVMKKDKFRVKED